MHSAGGFSEEQVCSLSRKVEGGKADGIRVCLRLRDDGKHQTFGEVQIKPEIPARGSLPRNLVGGMGNRVQDC